MINIHSELMFIDGTIKEVSQEDMVKVEGWWSSAYSNYIAARNSLLGDESIQGVTLACECLEKIMKGILLVENPVFYRANYRKLNHVPWSMLDGIESQNIEVSKYFNVFFLKFLEDTYRLRYKPEDRSNYENGFHIVINNLSILFELDRAVYNFNRMYKRNNFNQIVFEGNIWDSLFHSKNDVVSKDNIYLSEAFNPNDFNMSENISKHNILKNKHVFIVTEFWVETTGSKKNIREVTYECNSKKSIYGMDFFINNDKISNNLAYPGSKKYEYINFMKVKL